ncbi:PREDICTED: protein WVD2-like 4 isoform X1 [Nelumbo nucifera]|uniref:Protein WVD2-like 4 isoform X1 n=1 Tax=Nelumbo nucifera TaxID=4432 RepID=A0A1U7Z3Y7_NELNU|nr:PREDICTED: protein WVD2-like 4 isoform X1 [Nelumbo nucifera]XP_010247908.1 PREDICTED: protein WVD2-like 4 isoform X1 [Nelumbo nucifera]XP_010247914.1 PREDICTED: protein WVD2-like 4 isoform X1 [Nelumbo nucifera]XP_010247921.1 PREDICTED: protein WVD2-like 4 isoform X1 [Nelumbo nucifera]XP_010247925.1 PREDICTED: protein WVD2-like 4 isoform X1 [Nelumbo nucifera]
MDSESGAVLENGNGIVEESSPMDNGVVEETSPMENVVLNINKENENADNDVDMSQVNGVSEDASQIEGINSSGEEVESSKTVSITKGSNTLKKPGSGRDNGLKNTKTPKDQANGKVPISFSRTQRPSMSQSLSFPSRGMLTIGLKKSFDVKSVKLDSKHTRANDTESEASVSNGHATSSTSRVNNLNRKASNGVSSVDAKSNGGGFSARRTTLTSASSIRRSVVSKSVSLDATGSRPQPKEHPSNGQDLKLMKQALPVKHDEDAQSTTSSTTPRGIRKSTGSGFAFRLDERAEKRKEFFSKLEEKIHAKELEKNNLQEKTKESQEAEIKQLRKSLTFKATPMPCFYKEPPPKVELKKIPTTRAVSPKLGRHKSSADNHSEGSCQSPRPDLEAKKSARGATNTTGDSTGLKKPVRKSISKLSSLKSADTKTEVKPLKSKPKTIEAEHDSQEACIGETEEDQNKPIDSSLRIEATAGKGSIENSAENDVSMLLPDSGITSDEVVKG